MRRATSWPHLFYLWLVVGLGIWFLVATFPRLDWNQGTGMLVLATLIVLAQWLAVILPQGRLSAGFAVYLAIFALYGPAAGAWLMGVATAFGQGVVNRGQPLRMTLFNASRTILAALGAGFAYNYAGGSQPVMQGSNALPLLALVLTYGIINRLLYYICLLPDRRAYPAAFWWDVLRLDLMIYLFGVPFGLLMGYFHPQLGIYGVALLFMPLLALQMLFGFYLHQMQTQRMLRLLHNVVVQLAGGIGPKAMLSLVLEEIYKLLPYHTGVIYLRSAHRDQYPASHIHGPQSWLLAGTILRPGDGFLGLALDEGVPHLIYDTRRDARTAGEAESELRQLHRSLMVVPLVVDSQVLGLLLLGDKRVGFFKEKHLPLIVTMAAQLALALALLVTNQLEEG